MAPVIEWRKPATCLIALLCALTAMSAACISNGAEAPPTPEPTASVPATVESSAASEADLQATVQAMVAATVAAVYPTATVMPEPDLSATVQAMQSVTATVPHAITPTPHPKPVPPPTAQPTPTLMPQTTPAPIPTPTPMPASYLPPNVWSHRPVFNGGIDLGVTYIERWPKFERYKVDYFAHDPNCGYPFSEDNGPIVCPEQDGMKRWPDAGEMVTLIGHVWNFGGTASGPFEYDWEMDDEPIATGNHNGLESGENALFTLSIVWPGDEHNPIVSFAVDTGGEIDEIIEDNNVIVDWLKGYTIGFLFSPEAYKSLTLSNEPGRRFQSPEHWVHTHVGHLNELLIEAELDDRVRAELFFITDDARHYWHRDLWYMDGVWKIWHGADSFTLEGYKNRPRNDHGLLHELMHQLGVIDLYRMYIGTQNSELPDANRQGFKAGCGTDYWSDDLTCFRLPDDIADLMGAGEVFIGPHTAGGLKVNEGYRRGYYGEYLYDTPSMVSVKIVDEDDQVLPNVGLRFYQYDEFILDAIPEFELMTDSAGVAILPNRGITGIITATGHQLRPNPFGVIDVVGTNGTFVIEMQGSCTNYEWLTIVELNLAYWDGLKDHAMFTKTLRCPPPQSQRRDCSITGPAADREALTALYDATDGANWLNNDNWLSDVLLSEWHGVKTDESGCVARLELHNNELIGRIPPELGDLLNLRSLMLDGNRLNGEIPSELGNLTNLRFLRLSANQLSGAIPHELGRLANLESLEITDNHLSGEIPLALGSLANLSNLRLYRNRLIGPIPSQLGRLHRMKSLHLHNNQLSGEIPTELGNLVNLEGIELIGNHLTGCIPSALQNVRYNDFARLGLSFCE